MSGFFCSVECLLECGATRISGLIFLASVLLECWNAGNADVANDDVLI
jgi:hypothetical protein